MITGTVPPSTLQAAPETYEARSEQRKTIAEAISETREVYFGGRFQAVPIYWRDRLPPQQAFGGPCIVEESGSTSVITPRFRGHVDAWGNIVLNAGKT